MIHSLLGVWRQVWGGSVIVGCLATTVGWFSHCWVFGDNSGMVQSLFGVWQQLWGGSVIVGCLATTVGWFSHC